MITGFALVDHIVGVATQAEGEGILPPPEDLRPEQLSPEELAGNDDAEQEAERDIAPEDQVIAPPRLPGVLRDPRFAPSDDTLPDEVLDMIAAQEEPRVRDAGGCARRGQRARRGPAGRAAPVGPLEERARAVDPS